MHVLFLKPPVTVYNACNTAIMLKELERLRFRNAAHNPYVIDVCLTKFARINIYENLIKSFEKFILCRGGSVSDIDVPGNMEEGVPKHAGICTKRKEVIKLCVCTICNVSSMIRKQN